MTIVETTDVLGANILDIKTSQPYLKPYTIIERQGVKIAILGLTELGIEKQLPAVMYSGMKPVDMVETAPK